MKEDTVSRGDPITHVATALNAKDLHNEVAKRCPEGTAIPSVQWLRWQFWPRHAGKCPARLYCGRVKVKFMVMARQFRKSHEDALCTLEVPKRVRCQISQPCSICVSR